MMFRQLDRVVFRSNKTLRSAIESLNETAGFTDTERNNFTDMIENRVDAFRHINGNEVKYSYWSNFNNARNKNIGWRIDYFILSESLKDKIKSCDILTDVKGSDHAPIIMDIDL